MLDFRRDNNFIYTLPYYNCMLFLANKHMSFSELKNNHYYTSYDNLLSSICNGSLVIRNGEYEYRPYHDMSYYQNGNIAAIPYRAHWNKSIHSTQIRDWDDTAPDEVIDNMNNMVECIVNGH